MKPIQPMSILAFGIFITASGCTAISGATSTVKVDGSSTVYPIVNLAATEFRSSTTNQPKIKVNLSGTGGGFKKFCAGETDINAASRPILLKEMDACKQAKVAYIELPIALDAITVAVNSQNTWAQDITIPELKKLWEPAAQGKITTWKQIRSEWPDRPIHLYGSGRNSGTYDYFTQVLIGTDGAIRQDYTVSQNTSDVAEKVIHDPDGLGYFGFGEYQSNASRLKALAINSGKGAILPTPDTVQKAQYQPLTRPLFIYINAHSAQAEPELKAFVDFYLKNADRMVRKVGYIPLPAEGYRLNETHFYQAIVRSELGGYDAVGTEVFIVGMGFNQSWV
jgi:phosphate transport system substrate-binding protein